MASRGIRDRVAIVGMGCTEFGEHWDRGVGDMVQEQNLPAESLEPEQILQQNPRMPAVPWLLR